MDFESSFQLFKHLIIIFGQWLLFLWVVLSIRDFLIK